MNQLNANKFQPFTHRIFADFSGDDGDPTTRGSTKIMCTAWVITEEHDIGHNLSIIAQMKRSIGCKPDNELKYKALKKHPKKTETLRLLSKLKVRAMVAPILKDRIHDANLRNPNTKTLMQVIHQFPLENILRNLSSACPDIYFQLVFDKISWRKTQKDIENHFQLLPTLDWSRARSDWLKFDDWTNYPMLQLADVLAGLGAEYIESLDPSLLRICSVCFMKLTDERYPPRPRACRGVGQLGKLDLLLVLKPLLLRDNNGHVWDEGFVVRPPAARQEYVFVDCDVVRAKENAAVRAG